MKPSDVETVLDEVMGEGLGTEIQMASSSKERVFRAENTQHNSSEAETNLASVRTEQGWWQRGWQTRGAGVSTDIVF